MSEEIENKRGYTVGETKKERSERVREKREIRLAKEKDQTEFNRQWLTRPIVPQLGEQK